MIKPVEDITNSDKIDAHNIVNVLLKILPISKKEKTGIVDGFQIKLIYPKIPTKRDSNLLIYMNDEWYSLKFLHPSLNKYNFITTNELTAFVLNHQEEVEQFISNL